MLTKFQIIYGLNKLCKANTKKVLHNYTREVIFENMEVKGS